MAFTYVERIFPTLFVSNAVTVGINGAKRKGLIGTRECLKCDKEAHDLRKVVVQCLPELSAFSKKASREFFEKLGCARPMLLASIIANSKQCPAYLELLAHFIQSDEGLKVRYSLLDRAMGDGVLFNEMKACSILPDATYFFSPRKFKLALHDIGVPEAGQLFIDCGGNFEERNMHSR